MSQENRLGKPQRHDSPTEELDWSKPLVTIRCITYNHKDFIRDALDGFVMQETSFPFEAIVHDDASTDGTVDIILEYAAKYPHIIKPVLQKENQYSKGKDSHMDSDITAATSPHSKYIALCEGDDYWTKPYKLQKQVDFMETHPDVTLCFHNAMYHFENGVTNRFIRYRNEDGTPKDYLVAENLEDRFYNFEETFYDWFHPTASWLIKKEIFNSPEYAKLRTIPTPNGDDKIRYTCACFGRLYSFAEPMSVYRIQSGGISQYFSNPNYISLAYKTRYYSIKYLKPKFKYRFSFFKFYLKEYTSCICNIINSNEKREMYKTHLRNIIKETPLLSICFTLGMPLGILLLILDNSFKRHRK